MGGFLSREMTDDYMSGLASSKYRRATLQTNHEVACLLPSIAVIQLPGKLMTRRAARGQKWTFNYDLDWRRGTGLRTAASK